MVAFVGEPLGRTTSASYPSLRDPAIDSGMPGGSSRLGHPGAHHTAVPPVCDGAATTVVVVVLLLDLLMLRAALLRTWNGLHAVQSPTVAVLAIIVEPVVICPNFFCWQSSRTHHRWWPCHW